jgi:hypothetical protein
MSKRSFVVVAVNESPVSKTGRYLCSTPAGAAKKAFNELARKKMSKSKLKFFKEKILWEKKSMT